MGENLAPPISGDPRTRDWFRDRSLEMLAEQLHERAYFGYPPQDDRLVVAEPAYDLRGRIVLPWDGPWHVNQHDNKPHGTPPLPGPSAFPDGTRFDCFDRPIHPWLEEMITNPDIGVATGTGAYWAWGENITVDPIPIRHDLSEPHILMIERGDTGHVALAGGFWDKPEPIIGGNIREAREETGIDLSRLMYKSQLIYDGPVGDMRTTAHAWPRTKAIRFDLLPNDKYESKLLAEMTAGNRWQQLLRTVGRYAFKETIARIPWKGADAHEAPKAMWVPASEVGKLVVGSHRLLIELALG